MKAALAMAVVVGATLAANPANAKFKFKPLEALRRANTLAAALTAAQKTGDFKLFSKQTPVTGTTWTQNRTVEVSPSRIDFSIKRSRTHEDAKTIVSKKWWLLTKSAKNAAMTKASYQNDLDVSLPANRLLRTFKVLGLMKLFPEITPEYVNETVARVAKEREASTADFIKTKMPWADYRQ